MVWSSSPGVPPPPPPPPAAHLSPDVVALSLVSTQSFVVGAVSTTYVSLPVPTIKSPLASYTDLGSAALAKSYAVLTELGVAAVVTDVLAVESVSWTIPVVEVVAVSPVVTTLLSMLTVTAPDVPPPVSPVPATTDVMSPVSLAIHSSPVAVAELTLKIYPLVDAAARRETVSLAVPTIKSPLASTVLN